jgi:hypothetical protein
MCTLTDSVGTPLSIMNPAFARPWCSDVDERAASSVPWADAFEDLLSLQQTGQMPERDRSKSGTDQWLGEMVHRGSLGSSWALDDEGQLVKQAIDPKTSQAGEDKWDHWFTQRRGLWGRCRRYEDASQHFHREKEDETLDHIVNRATASLPQFPMLGGVFSMADSIMEAIVEAAQQQKRDQNQDRVYELPGDEVHELSAEEAADQSDLEPKTTSYTSLATSSSSSYSYEGTSSSSESNTKSVTSTLTKTMTRTLPDGSLETTRVLRKRFSDGTEESDESVEVSNLPQPKPIQETVDKQTQTHTPVQNAITQVQQTQEKLQEHDQGHAERHRGGSGWFWT